MFCTQIFFMFLFNDQLLDGSCDASHLKSVQIHLYESCNEKLLHGSDCEHVMFVSPYLFKCAQVTSSELKLQKRFDVLYLNLFSCFCSMISSSMGAVMPVILKVFKFIYMNHAMRSTFMGAIVNM